jgi:molybdopterin/thiamine biosynthesis adenylyltransferase
MVLSEPQMLRYARHIVLPEMGGAAAIARGLEPESSRADCPVCGPAGGNGADHG